MKSPLALALLLSCAACSQQDVPADDVVAAAEEIVVPALQPAPLAKGQWAPQDTCASVKGATAFRERLTAAIEARDADALIVLAADDIKLDFGGGAGETELRRRLTDASLDLWGELDALLTLGCSANRQGGITIPWYFDQNLGTTDPYGAMLVTGEDVSVFEAPDAASRRLAALSWDTVEIATLDLEKPYQQVELADGTIGFVVSDQLRSLVDYRLIASSRNGRWRITSFVAGD